MTGLEAYNDYLIKINKNDTNRNIKIPKGQFVLMFNQQAPIWLTDTIEKNIKTDRIDDIAELLNLDTLLEKKADYETSSDFILPSDFHEYSNSYCLAEKQGCSESVVYCWNTKNKNKNTLFQNENEKPSFEYQETFIQLNKDVVKVYTDGFNVTKYFLDYYRLPLKIDIEGYIKSDGSSSTRIDPDISDYLVNKIVDYCALETIRIYQNPESFPLAKDRIIN